MLEINFDNFDVDYYYQKYPDLQSVCQGWDLTKRNRFLYAHFQRHGRREKREYRLKSTISGRERDHDYGHVIHFRDQPSEPSGVGSLGIKWESFEN